MNDDLPQTIATLAELADMPEERARRLRELIDAIDADGESAQTPALVEQLDELRWGGHDPQVSSLARRAWIAAGRARIGLGPAREAVPGHTRTLLRLRHTRELERHYARVNSGRALEQRYTLGTKTKICWTWADSAPRTGRRSAGPAVKSSSSSPTGMVRLRPSWLSGSAARSGG